MTHAPVQTARSWPIRLRRNPLRMLAVVGLRALIGGAGVLTGLSASGTVGTVVTAAGVVVMAYAALLGLYLATIRLEARPGELWLRSLLGTRRYVLAPGPVTRLWVQFTRGPLETRVGGLGIKMGEGELGGEELADVIALDRASTLLMVPTSAGRLAIAAASEEELLHALRLATAEPPQP